MKHWVNQQINVVTICVYIIASFFFLNHFNNDREYYSDFCQTIVLYQKDWRRFGTKITKDLNLTLSSNFEL